jgi:hypothetical protein
LLLRLLQRLLLLQLQLRLLELLLCLLLLLLQQREPGLQLPLLSHQSAAVPREDLQLLVERLELDLRGERAGAEGKVSKRKVRVKRARGKSAGAAGK